MLADGALSYADAYRVYKGTRTAPEQEISMMQEDQKQGQQEEGQQPGPLHLLGRTLTDIRKVQTLLELNYPNQTDAIKM